MPVLSCSIMFMGDQGLFLHRHVKVADLQNHFQMCCFLTIVIGFFYSFFIFFLFASSHQIATFHAVSGEPCCNTEGVLN